MNCGLAWREGSRPCKSAGSNKNQTLQEITPVQAIPSPPTALNAHSTPVPFIDKISVLFELPTEQDAYETHLAILGRRRRLQGQGRLRRREGRQVGTEVERDGKISRSTRYCLSSARLSAERFAQAARAHWSIENGLHWVLDTAFDEDRARNRKDHGAENLAVIRKLALNVLKRARPEISTRRKRKRSGWSDAFARSVLGQMR
ncbi:MAG: ISAs1 family transposase [Roseiarcus sp.]